MLKMLINCNIIDFVVKICFFIHIFLKNFEMTKIIMKDIKLYQRLTSTFMIFR